MRKIITTLVILVLIIAAIPALVGQFLKYELERKLAHADWPKGYALKIISYSAGWFKSQANIQVSMSTPFLTAHPNLAANSQLTPEINLEIYHGPLTYTTNLAGQKQWFLGQGIVSGVAQLDDLPLAIYALVHFNSDIDLRIQNNGYQHKSQTAQVSLSLGGLQSQILISEKYTHVAGTSTIQNFSVIDPETNLTIPRVDSTFSLQKDGSGLWVGQRNNTIPQVSYVQKGAYDLLIQGIVFNTGTVVNNNLFAAAVNAQIQKITQKGYTAFGPANLSYTVNNVQVANLAAANQFFANADFSDNNPNRAQVVNQMWLHFAAIGQGSSQNLQNLSINTPRGLVNLSAQVNLPKLNVPVNQVQNRQAVNVMLTQLGQQAVAHIKFVLPTQLLFDVMNKLSPQDQTWMNYVTALRNAGVILSNGNYLTLELNYTPKASAINGIPLQNAMAQFQTQMQQINTQQQNSTGTTNNTNVQQNSNMTPQNNGVSSPPLSNDVNTGTPNSNPPNNTVPNNLQTPAPNNSDTGSTVNQSQAAQKILQSEIQKHMQ